MKQTNNQEETKRTCQKLIETTIERLAKQLEQGYSKQMTQYLQAMAHFHTYSLYNQFLIVQQYPKATRVAGFQTWKPMNRRVKKGERGIRILAPQLRSLAKEQPDDFNQQIDGAKNEIELFDSQNSIRDKKKFLTGFRSVCVFDIAQTEGQDLPEPSQAQGDPSAYLLHLESSIRDSGIQLEHRHIGSPLGMAKKGAIFIRPGMPSAETFSTLTHEYAHHLLGHVEKRNSNQSVEELEADAVACVVSERFGIQAIQASADYIKLYKGDKEKLIEHLERIRACASRIITAIETRSEISSRSSIKPPKTAEIILN